MKHTYDIIGMSCNGCRTKVEKTLSEMEGIQSAEVTLNPPVAIIIMEKHISTKKMQAALSAVGNYSIKMSNDHDDKKQHTHVKEKSEHIHHHSLNVPDKLQKNSQGKYYCPMQCEGDKVYGKMGSCPVCGMNLEKIPELSFSKTQYTCPIHPEIIEDQSGDCSICGMALIAIEPKDEEEDKTYKELLKKLKISIVFTLPIFIIAMSEMIPNNPFTKIFSQKFWNWIQFGLSLPVVFFATWMFFQRAWNSLKTWNLNMFTLIGIGAGAAFIFSIFAMLFPSIFPEDFKTESGTVFIYFEAVTVILTLVLLGQVLEARAHSQTSGAIKELLKLAPTQATILQNGIEKVIAINDIQLGNLIRVKPGEKIPVDGIITEGNTTIDESMITGEPIPVDKKVNDSVSSGTINGTKSFVLKAERVGADTLLSQIIQMVNDASRSQAPIQKLADKISKYFVPIVVGISILTFITWANFGPDPALVFAFVNAIAVLIIACPCALGLATPMSVMVGVGKGAQSGVLIKNAEALEKMDKIDILLTDKTGTITEGKPSVEKIIPVNDINVNTLLQNIASLNQYSEHPLAEAVVKYGIKQNVELISIDDFEAIAGKGVIGTIHGKKVALGNQKLMEQLNIQLSNVLVKQVEQEQTLGKTVSFIAEENEGVGFVVLSDAIKNTSQKAIQSLMEKGIEVVMLTGDNHKTATAVANKLKLSKFKAECLPEDKLKEIKALQAEGKVVAMAGDGINDAPALAQSDIGIAMGTGTDVAIESAEITLLKGDLQGIVKAKNLSQAVMKNIKQNLFFAFVYNIIGVPIAAGVLYPFFGILLSPMIAAAAMSFSSVSVITNSLRLRHNKL